VVRVHALPTDLPRVLACAEEHAAGVVGRASVGTCWLSLPAGADVAAIRAALAPRPCVITDAPAAVRARLDPWDVAEGPELELMRRLKERFDPERKCNPGVYAGGI
jgi:glycolate oxidase FAD binding subunit